MIDVLTQLVEAGSYSVDLDINPYYSKADELHKVLMNEAAIDARKTADMIAETLGTTIRGPKKVDLEKYYRDDEIGGLKCIALMDMSIDSLAEIGYKETAFSKLRTPTTTEKETVNIEWELQENNN